MIKLGRRCRFLDEDTCYPVYKYPYVAKPYRKLAYDGPIWRVEDREESKLEDLSGKMSEGMALRSRDGE